jgi:Mce-associated membrane protein
MTSEPESPPDGAETAVESPESPPDGAETAVESPESPPDGAETAVESPESPTDSAEAPADARPSKMAAISRLTARSREKWRSILLVASVIAAVGLATGLFFFQYRPDRQLDDAAARRAIQAASDGAVASLSYSTDNMDRDFANAKSHLTGEFLAYYDTFTKQIVTPAVQQKHITQTAAVVRAAVSELHPNSAVVLVFLNETTASKDKSQPLITPSSVRITLTKVSGAWLISKLDPVA